MPEALHLPAGAESVSRTGHNLTTVPPARVGVPTRRASPRRRRTCSRSSTSHSKSWPVSGCRWSATGTRCRPPHWYTRRICGWRPVREGSAGPADQFYHAAAEAMRRILIEHARARGRVKRGGRRPLRASSTCSNWPKRGIARKSWRSTRRSALSRSTRRTSPPSCASASSRASPSRKRPRRGDRGPFRRPRVGLCAGRGSTASCTATTQSRPQPEARSLFQRRTGHAKATEHEGDGDLQRGGGQRRRPPRRLPRWRLRPRTPTCGRGRIPAGDPAARQSISR